MLIQKNKKTPSLVFLGGGEEKNNHFLKTGIVLVKG